MKTSQTGVGSRVRHPTGTSRTKQLKGRLSRVTPGAAAAPSRLCVYFGRRPGDGRSPRHQELGVGAVADEREAVHVLVISN